ncbi:hypothetical protein NDU88_005562 [Pleurodeles waltl]|uniref:Uncharacterized protein n=1 Tax=Pleurodeles waltl TaxID=8319 RepID=A0AAV7TUB0_PLEWA|nr:hypothetical protein NDU88_005562 [Pleurodeles waltl]
MAPDPAWSRPLVRSTQHSQTPATMLHRKGGQSGQRMEIKGCKSPLAPLTIFDNIDVCNQLKPGTSRAFDCGDCQEAGSGHKQLYLLFGVWIGRGTKETPMGPQLCSHNSVPPKDSLSLPVQHRSDPDQYYKPITLLKMLLNFQNDIAQKITPCEIKGAIQKMPSAKACSGDGFPIELDSEKAFDLVN